MQQTQTWWNESFDALYELTPGLLSCTGPAELEDAVCVLLGQHWRQAFAEQMGGLSLDGWLEELIGDAASLADQPSGRYLLHGIQAIASPYLAEEALIGLNSKFPPPDEPEWLESTAWTVASPDILILRDGYGLRFGLLIDVTGRDRQPRTYLFDVDLCHGFRAVLGVGYHPDAAAGATAWREMVGPSADSAVTELGTPQLLARVLPLGGIFDHLGMNPFTAEHFTECYRADRVARAASNALRRARRPLASKPETSRENETRALRMSQRFITWLGASGLVAPTAAAGDDAPDPERIEAFLSAWFQGLPEEFCLGCSPHRIAAFTAYLNDDWQEVYRKEALELLEPWVQYCIEQTNLPDHLARPALAIARRARLFPAEVGGDLGNHLNRPMSEDAPAPQSGR